ncbi:potassium transporter KtrA [Synergistales bacterium]|nr:potassium transporter KtrA [Synergistales bacterium]
MAIKKKRKTYMIVGLGRFGVSMCSRLAELGAHVIAVDRNRDLVEAISDKLEYVAQIDSTDEAALVKLGAKVVDVAVVCIGEKMEDSILTTAILKELGVPRIIARAADELQARILYKVGAHKVILPESEMGHRIADVLENPWMNNFIGFEDDKLIMGKMPILGDMVGKTLKDLALPSKYGCTVAMIERRGKKILPNANVTLELNDEIWVFGEREQLEPLLNSITSREE